MCVGGERRTCFPSPLCVGAAWLCLLASALNWKNPFPVEIVPTATLHGSGQWPGSGEYCLFRVGGTPQGPSHCSWGLRWENPDSGLWMTGSLLLLSFSCRQAH